MYFIFANIAGSLKVYQKMESFAYKNVFFSHKWPCKEFWGVFCLLLGKILIMSRLLRNIENISKLKKKFCWREANECRFPEHRIPVQHKFSRWTFLPLELIQNLREVVQTAREISNVVISVHLIENDDGNFQRQNMTTEISKGRICSSSKMSTEISIVKTLGDTRWPNWKLLNSNMELIQDYFGNGQKLASS